MKQLLTALLLLALARESFSQTQDTLLPVKVRHAEPLYIDLIRDLGARKGEKEWNAGWVTESQTHYVQQTAFVEYEFSPLNRLGLEVEVPLSFYQPRPAEQDDGSTHRNRIEGIKMAAQYTLLVSKEKQLSVAAGYIHEFMLHSFYTIRNEHALLKGNGFNPFLIAAKRFGSSIHTLVYTGPAWETIHGAHRAFAYQLNTSVHYMLPSKHFIGIELNEEFSKHITEIIARPQVKVVLAPNFAIGFATGIPVHAHDHSISFLTRMIFEPGNRK